jgi:hypothetical protein
MREDPQVRATAAAALAELGSQAGPALLELLANLDVRVRDAVLVPIGTLGRKDEQVVEALVRQLRRGANETDRAYAALALAEVGPAAEMACSALTDVFPIVTTTSPINWESISPTSGGIVDYTVNRQVVDASNVLVHMYFATELGLYGDYFEITEAHGVSSVYSISISGVSTGTDFSLQATATTRLYAGAFTLARISGMDLGRDRDKWREWLRSRPVDTR